MAAASHTLLPPFVPLGAAPRFVSFRFVDRLFLPPSLPLTLSLSLCTLCSFFVTFFASANTIIPATRAAVSVRGGLKRGAPGFGQLVRGGCTGVSIHRLNESVLYDEIKTSEYRRGQPKGGGKVNPVVFVDAVAPS